MANLAAEIRDYFHQLWCEEPGQFYPRLIGSVTHEDGTVDLEAIHIACNITRYNEVYVCSTVEEVVVGPDDWKQKVDNLLRDLHLQFTEDKGKICRRIANRNLHLMRQGAAPYPKTVYWQLVDDKGRVCKKPKGIEFVRT